MSNRDWTPTGAVLSMFFVMISFLLGMLCALMGYQSDTRECTIACPDNAESIKKGGACYCKLPMNDSEGAK